MMTLVVDGNSFTNFKKLEVSRSLDNVSGMFSFEATTDKETNWPIEIGQKAAVFIGDQAVLTGFVERIDVSHSVNEHSISIAGRDVTADILDSIAQKKDIQGGTELVTIARETLAAGNIPIEVKTDPAGLEIRPFTDQEIEAAETGEKIVTFLAKYCQKRQVFQGTDGEGALVFARAGQRTSMARLLHVRGGGENNIKTGAVSFDHSSRFNTYRVTAQQNPIAAIISAAAEGAEAIGIPTNFDIANQSAVVTDPDIRASRFWEGNLESSGTVEECRARASWEANINRARSARYKGTVQGFHQDLQKTRLWKVNELVEVTDEFCNIDGRLLIVAVTYSLSTEGGSVTELICQAEDSYTPEPLPPANSGILGDIFGF